MKNLSKEKKQLNKKIKIKEQRIPMEDEIILSLLETNFYKKIRRRKDGFFDITLNNGDFIRKVTFLHLKNNIVKKKYIPRICNFGYVGYGKYNGGKNYKEYCKWSDMFDRCYSDKYQEKHPTYKGCEVCEEWHNFQNFCRWYHENLWCENFNVLDKDILVKGNKIYSPQNCCLLNTRLNTLFINRKLHRGNSYLGVKKKDNQKYFAQCNYIDKNGVTKRYFSRVFDTETEAFNVYKNFKENYIKQVADEYNSKYPNFPNKLYKAMYNYKVNIDD